MLLPSVHDERRCYVGRPLHALSTLSRILIQIDEEDSPFADFGFQIRASALFHVMRDLALLEWLALALDRELGAELLGAPEATSHSDTRTRHPPADPLCCRNLLGLRHAAGPKP